MLKLVTIIPAQKTSWGCGLHQSEAAIETAYINTKKRRKNKTSFEEVCAYPLAVDINIKDPTLQSVLAFLPSHERKKLEEASDPEGNFRVGALPHDLARYINTNLPKNYENKAEALSVDKFSGSELLDIIHHNFISRITYASFLYDRCQEISHACLFDRRF